MKKVIFILSVGHSGSTLLDIVLGQFNNTLSAGELKHLTWQYYRQINNRADSQNCTCGKSFDKCTIWASVINDLAKFRQTTNKFVPEKIPIRYFENLSFYKDDIIIKLLRLIYKKNLNYRLIPSILIHKYFNKVNCNNYQLYSSLFKHNPQIDYIIDSSKDIIRYNELKSKTKAFPIILIRNINEWTKSKYVKGSKSNIKSWIRYYNKYCLPLIKKMDENDFHIINYEMFINNPFSIISELAKKLEINMGEFNTTIKMQNVHLVAGNPIRYENEISIKQNKYIKADVIKQLEKSGLDSFFLKRL